MRPVDAADAGSLIIGEIRVDAVVDALTEFESAGMFAASPLPWPVSELDARFPGDFDGGRWRLIIRSFLIRSAGVSILVDAGAGPATIGLGQAMGIEGRLPERLAELDVDLASINHVVITHVHWDHVGWLVVNGGDGPRPTFPRARYHLHPADFAMAENQREGDQGRYWAEVFAPLAASGQLELASADRDLAPGVRLINAPGHTPGHRVVRATGGSQALLVVGDLVHFSFQINDPSIASPFDWDPVAAARTRARVLASAPGAIIASPHLPAAFTKAD